MSDRYKCSDVPRRRKREPCSRTSRRTLPLDLQEAQEILRHLKRGEAVSDFWFDALLPTNVRQFSQTHWTPLEVAIRAAELLVSGPKTRVLDVGSGPGKFCMIGALTTSGVFSGIEQRRSLFEIAEFTARTLGISRASFMQGNMVNTEWAHFDSFYLYNPFYETIESTRQIDQGIALGKEQFAYYVSVVEEKLKRLRSGSRVVTYHGFGGNFPEGYRRALKEPHGDDYLELWVKEPFLQDAEAIGAPP